MAGIETPIQFHDIPVIDTFPGLEAAVANLVSIDYACMPQLSPDAFPETVVNNGQFHDEDLTLRAVKLLLAKQNPQLAWTYFEGEPVMNKGLHADYDINELNVSFPRPLSAVVLDYHVTPPGMGDFSVTFASPAKRYDRRNLPRLRRLLEIEQTDPDFAVPESFRRARLENGGSVLFTLRRANARPQLHNFENHSEKRESKVTLIAGNVRK